MFVEACKLATGFTRPVVISRKDYNGDCSSIIGSYVVLNDQGWIATAWHVMEFFDKLEKSKAACVALDLQRAAIESDAKLTKNQRKGMLRKLPTPDASWTRDFSFWFGMDGLTVANREIIALPNADLAICRLEPFDAAKLGIKTYPLLKDPTKGVPIGTSLCKLGFPFHTITPSHTNGRFILPGGSVPPPFFPIEGMLTRNIQIGKASEGFTIGWMETSTPGLRGQSGGPIFDQKGALWAIQSSTAHYPLGFNPPVPGGKKGEVEHQFLNVGLGVHVETIVGFLKANGVAYQLSSH